MNEKNGYNSELNASELQVDTRNDLDNEDLRKIHSSYKKIICVAFILLQIL